MSANMLFSNQKHLFCLVAAAAMLAAAPAFAEIYKKVDANGRVTYSNVPMKGGVRLNLEAIGTVPAGHPRASSPTPVTFPRVDAETQKKRDETRRQILEDELSAEEKLLADAKKGSSKEETDLHLKNVEALKKEIANLK